METSVNITVWESCELFPCRRLRVDSEQFEEKRNDARGMRHAPTRRFNSNHLSCFSLGFLVVLVSKLFSTIPNTITEKKNKYKTKRKKRKRRRREKTVSSYQPPPLAGTNENRGPLALDTGLLPIFSTSKHSNSRWRVYSSDSQLQ